MSRFRLLGLVMALACGSASAHQTQPAGWCPVGTLPVIVSEFSFTPTQLAQYQAVQTGAAPGSTVYCDPKTCGIVDQWFWAHEMAASYCGGVGLRGTAPEDAVAFVDGPASFNTKYHHANYRYDQGPLTGQCVVCRAPRAVTPTRD